MSFTMNFKDVGRLPLPGDNVAIATRRLEAGTVVVVADGSEFMLSHVVLEGHRFAVREIKADHALLSWERPFGVALKAIAPGDYVCNQSVLETLAGRRIDFALPSAPNFADRIVSYQIDPNQFQPGRQVAPRTDGPVFQGYGRGARGVGTRNFIVVLATSSRTAGYAHRLAERMRDATNECSDIDGVVAVAHTEGGTRETPNNANLLLRTLAGFVVHPNVGAILAVDYGSEPINNRTLLDFMAAERYPLDDVRHAFLSLDGDFEAQLSSGERVIRRWLAPVNAAKRSDQPLAGLKVALQCGGSDAFSGISGNPLAAWAARELIRCGGSAVLAETDELIGAESYILQNVRDLHTAQQFLHMIERFKERVAWHGTSAEGNPSGGNKLRGLYNIVLKSIGAAAKSHPDVRLDSVIDYAQRMSTPGFHFMDSPGNDLESIAGEVASGCNLIYFVTGNGSITNFPFVPTVKIVTTTRRYELLSADMDVNAGAYLDGVPLDTLGHELFTKTLGVAAGARTRGEHAGHSQVSIWRNWQQRDGRRLAELLASDAPDGAPLPVPAAGNIPEHTFRAIRCGEQTVTDRMGLILPTSLCSGQIARLCAERLNAKGLGRAQGISRFAALPHTEGCGSSGTSVENILARTMMGYATHPLVKTALLLEHGCEKTHNDFMRDEFAEQGVDAERFGWASVQMDGGIDRVLDRVESWFAESISGMEAPVYEDVGAGALRVGLLSNGPIAASAASALAVLTRWIVTAGGTVVVPEHDRLLHEISYVTGVLEGGAPDVCLANGQGAHEPGFYVMAAPAEECTEIITGLGATGMELLLAHVGEHPLQGHPLVPVLQISTDDDVVRRFGDDMDLRLGQPADTWPDQILGLLVCTGGREYTARAAALGNTAFQVSRGLLGVSS